MSACKIGFSSKNHSGIQPIKSPYFFDSGKDTNFSWG